MKICDYKNLSFFLATLFTFFKENGIEPSYNDIDDYDKLLERIIESEYIKMSYYPGMYCVDFKLKEKIEKGEVYFFIFGSENNSSSLLLDLGEKGLVSFFNFSWDLDKHPPFLKDFADINGRIKISPEVPGYDSDYLSINDVMTFEEFQDYLSKNREQRFLNVIEVE